MLKQMECKSKQFKSIPTEKMPTLWAMDKYLTFHTEQLTPLIQEVATQPMDGMHGLNTHTISVVARGIDCALHMGCEPMPVVLACAFHDIARTDDSWDTDHAKNAVPLAMKIMKKTPELLDTFYKQEIQINPRKLNDFYREIKFNPETGFEKQVSLAILSAIRNHTTCNAASDYISACLCDADRVRLSWKYGYEEKYFNTQRGKYIAQHYKSYLDMLKQYFPHIRWSKEY